MPLLDKAPHIKILEGAAASLGLVDDWEETTGTNVNTIRHSRNRFPTKSEGNAISLRWVGNADSDVEEQYKNAWERYRRCNIDIEYDFRLKAESTGEDPTGWGDISRVNARSMLALRDEDGPLMQLCNWVIDGDDDPDEDSKPDEGRLVKRISVVYRVRTDDPNVLLALGENAP